MRTGKRRSTAEPLTQQDAVAERLAWSALRTLQILAQSREMGQMESVRRSRYHHDEVLKDLAAEIAKWGR